MARAARQALERGGKLQKMAVRAPKGLVVATLKKCGLIFLREFLPEDFNQEVELFLLGWPTQKIETDLKGFFRSAQRHFYKMARAYGYVKPKGSWHYRRPISCGLHSKLEKREDRLLEEQAILSFNRSAEVQEWMEFCAQVLKKGDFALLKLFLSGYSPKEIAALSEVSVGVIRQRLKKIIASLKKEAEAADEAA